MKELLNRANNQTLTIIVVGSLTAMAMALGETDIAQLLGGALVGGATFSKASSSKK